MEIQNFQAQLPLKDEAQQQSSGVTVYNHKSGSESTLGEIANAKQSPSVVASPGGTIGATGMVSPWTMANAAIKGVVNFLNSVTTMWEAPPQPVQRTPPPPPPSQTPRGSNQIAPEHEQSKPIAPETQGPTPSLIPSWAKIFEYTGRSEWHAGGASQNGYVDLRRELKDKIKSIEILSADGSTVLATGKLEKVGTDGRPRYRFNKSGRNLPEGALIKATLVDNKDGGHGGIRYIEIPKPEKTFRW